MVNFPRTWKADGRVWADRATIAAWLLCALLSASGCSLRKNPIGADGGAHADASDGKDDHLPDSALGDRPADSSPSGTVDGGCAGREAGAVMKTAGDPCSCAGECESGFCVDGFCCNEACAGGCRTCARSGSEGTCVGRPIGSDPRSPSDCEVSPVASCGRDGKCDGAGACSTYPAGTMCQPGTCQGAAVSGMLVCDGAGTCRAGPTVICGPFSCDPSAGDCYQKCTASTQCIDGHTCDGSGSCGKALNGARCTSNDGCLSGFCVDKVCCNVACEGPCVSCALPSREGSCWPVDADLPDARGVCKDAGAASCGQNGKCDGVGGCALYPVDTECAPPACSGTRLNTAATCDGLGTCRAPGLTNCSPFMCAEGACTVTCTTDADCDKGIACSKGTCGKKQNGQSCTAAGECNSNLCVDGVCCDSACTGACRSCALPSSPGKCTMVGAGNADSRAVCKDAGAASCGQNGKCDGAGGCQLYSKTTTCKAESCSSNVYTPVSTCDGAGRCVTPAQLPCSPFACNGSKCFVACTADSQCVSPNRCTSNSCGTSNNGAACSTGSQCKSGFCAQGYCCNTACKGACQSCALPGTLGACTNVATGSSDPAGMCKDQGAASCGNNGKCQAGACQKYSSGTSCAGATCPSGTPTFTATSTCDGNGKCVTPGTRSCAPYSCGSAACKSVCTSNSDCASPAVCMSGSCGLKSNGAVCSDNGECNSKLCRQGVCCATECNGTCKSCSASGATAGTCTNVTTGGTDPTGTCKDQGRTSCGTNGVCDGSGGCQRYPINTVCADASCPAGKSTQTNARTCDGAGTCRTAATVACAPFLCNGTNACNSACKADADCLSPDICDPKTNLCGTYRRQGQACSATADCLKGLTCVDGVCCASTSCPLCQACNVSGSGGTCAGVPAGTAEPHGMCKASPPCGFTGACSGGGSCQNADASVTCSNASCTGSTYTSAAKCDGAGKCGTPLSMDCNGYVCGGTTCKSSCTADTDCVPPLTCQGSGTKSCTLKANGVACSAAGECSSGNCTDGYCCNMPSCGACNACNVSGKQGTCSGTAANSTDTRCGSTGSTCGVTNTCDGAGKCRTSTATCATASCSGSTFTPAASCSGTSTSCPTAPTDCSPYGCTTSGCKASCTSDSDCASGFACSGGKCASGGGLGKACTSGGQCASGHCVDGVCCSSASCDSCYACNPAGTCAPQAAGSTDTSCPATSPCGVTNVCDGAGSCRTSTATCATASCSGSTFTPAASCSGTKSTCPTAPTDCSPYGCTTSGCKASCTSDSDCASGFACSGGKCASGAGLGKACTSGGQCASGHCVDGVCCSSASCNPCYACSAAGTCAPQAAGSTDNSCPATSPCGVTNVCDGAGNCRISTAMCAAESCTDATHSEASFCSGTSSTCPAPAKSSCAPYACGGSTCKTQCSTDGDCSPGDYYCDSNGQCVGKVRSGGACSSTDQCATGVCGAEGVCCDSACAGSCESCKLPGSKGTCSPVTDGTTCEGGGCCTAGLCTNCPMMSLP